MYGAADTPMSRLTLALSGAEQIHVLSHTLSPKWMSLPQDLGVIVLEILSADKGDDEGTWDPLYSGIVIVFNARAETWLTAWPEGVGPLPPPSHSL